MNKLKRVSIIIVLSVMAISLNGCDPFEERYLTLALDTELNRSGIGPDISITGDLCLSDEDDYNDNKDDIEEIRYIASAYTTLSASNGLRGTDLTLRVFQSDGVTLLFDYVIPTFIAEDYIDNPLKIELSPQEADNLNLYLRNHQQNNCFRTELTVNGTQDDDGPPFFINGKVRFLAEIKIEP